MTAEIYIISGFLGAGKTTLIRKLIGEAFQNSNVALIENDFGDISVDAALMKDTNIEIREMNSGCICCSISGDFVNSVRDLLEKFCPDKIIIEPSGVGKLSDIYKYCLDRRIRELAKVKAKISVVDVRYCKKYLDNFGEFFQDQIENADTVLLSRTNEYPDKIEGASELINNLNTKAPILSKAWNDIQFDELMPSSRRRPDYKALGGCRVSKHKHEHKHSADEIFDTITIRTKRTFTYEELTKFIEEIYMRYGEKILRIKGILRSTDGNLNLQYVPGDMNITACSTTGDMLCIIGHGLNRQDIISVFNGGL
ncbi:GTP-binding protein [Sedimentibacter hydroxybenzoicus DSM 7310]|uniref:GTP-binding protein n=1 Tax=Sedimentibacter hydroxybenzoicus DSM 7310 TaxID=1123245 RepID=A0A974BMC6_SEDHY|nr:GTP-binding protein [Sedimentibacter hydroxybenzoicus]NYB75813.1 GTP-binding protein [Sedimentibacter hydroxybenzoicus DSM 7310]